MCVLDELGGVNPIQEQRFLSELLGAHTDLIIVRWGRLIGVSTT